MTSARSAVPVHLRWTGTAAVLLAVGAIIALWPDAFTRWHLPKAAVLVVAAVLASMTAPAGRLPRWVWVFVAIGGGFILCAALVGDAPLAQVMGRWPRYEGLIMLPVYVAAVWIGARLLGPESSGLTQRRFALAAAVAAALLFGVSVAEALGGRPLPSDLDRPGALLGNASDQGLIGVAFAALLSPWVFAAARSRVFDRYALVLTVGMLASVGTVVLSASRGAIVALVVAMVTTGAILVAHAPRGARRRLVLGAGAAIVGVIILALLTPTTASRLTGASPLASRTIEDRITIWQETIGLLAKQPVLGVGPSGYLDAIAAEHGSDWYASGSGTVLESPHNWLLQLASAGGILLLLCGLAFVAYVGAAAFRRLRPGGRASPNRTAASEAGALNLVGAIAALAGLAIGLLTHFTGAAVGITAGLLIGIVVAVSPRIEPAWWRAGRSAALGLWALALVLAVAGDVALQRAVTAPTLAEAEAGFERAAALRPWDADVTSIAAQVLAAHADQGDRAAAVAAVRWADRSLALVPRSTVTRMAAAVALRGSGEPASLTRAIELLEELTAEQPADPQPVLQLGLAFAAAGDLDAARAAWQQVLVLRPDDATARALLEAMP